MLQQIDIKMFNYCVALKFMQQIYPHNITVFHYKNQFLQNINTKVNKKKSLRLDKNWQLDFTQINEHENVE